MAGGFSDDERERIREGLITAGRDLFARYGRAKTTIADLTGAVGIAPSTFYQFFDSKDDLYLRAVEREGHEAIPRILEASFETHDDPQAAIAAFMHAFVDELETNPLFRRLFADPDELRRLREWVIEEEDTAEVRRQGVEFFLPYVQRWHEEGRVRGTDPETVALTIRMVGLVVLRREVLGDQYGPVRDLLVESVARGLTDVNETTPGAVDPD